MISKKQRLNFRYLDPAFFGGLLDDPLLFLRIRPLKRALLFDCGQIAHLAKRVIKPIDTVFISHAHMDHCMGIPTLVRHHHASPRPLDIFGPPGIAERVDHQLHGYDWNLCEPYWFTLRVHEVHATRLRHYSFSGAQAFAGRDDGETARHNKEIWSCRYVTVEAELLDHKLPVLAFIIRERPPFAVDINQLRRQGMVAGDWLRDLKSRVWKGKGALTIEALRQTGADSCKELVTDPETLYRLIRKDSPCASIGYLTDVGWTGENREKIGEFLAGVTLLCTECTFLTADRAKARASHHLCTQDLNELAEILQPRWLLPMHPTATVGQFAEYLKYCNPAGCCRCISPRVICAEPLTCTANSAPPTRPRCCRCPDISSRHRSKPMMWHNGCDRSASQPPARHRAQPLPGSPAPRRLPESGAE